MNKVDWEICQRRLIDKGVVGFTDGDIIAEYDELNYERLVAAQKAQDEALAQNSSGN